MATDSEPELTLGRPDARTLGFWAPLLGLSVLLAAYTGFRLPNLWSVTLYAVSLPDGFRRRFVVGTLLRPLAAALHHNYWFYATFALAVLATLLAVILVNSLRSGLASQRFLAVAFLLLPTGGFLFHEVGYLDQLLYLALFGSLRLLRPAAWAASALMTIAVLTHEIAILTVIPLFAFVLSRELRPRRAIAVIAPALIAAVVLLTIPAITPGAVEQLTSSMSVSNFTPRPDALSLFERTQWETWQLYSVRRVTLYLVPTAVVALVGFLLLHSAGLRGPHDLRSVVYVFLGGGAIVAPFALALAGADESRWAFLLTANFFVVLWVWLGDRGRELDARQWVTIVAALLIVVHVPMHYFDGYEPRALRTSAMSKLFTEVRDGALFSIPKR